MINHKQTTTSLYFSWIDINSLLIPTVGSQTANMVNCEHFTLEKSNLLIKMEPCFVIRSKDKFNQLFEEKDSKATEKFLKPA